MKILVIDDDASFRRILEYNLQEEGYEVLIASSGEEGLVIFDKQSPHLVITDMKMNGISGIDVLSAIKKQSPDTLVIIITAFGAVDKAVEAMKLGAYDYITKPVNRDELKLMVRKALDLTSLSQENKDLKKRIENREEFKHMVGTSDAMAEVFSLVSKVADTEAAILITGESGTGKELVARAIHEQSSRRNSPFVAINCAAIPGELLESELFGHVKGSFTGAIKDQQGKFQQADGGTIFLDEVCDLPLVMQPKLLRVLQEKEVLPVGSGKTQKIDVRVVAATNLDIEEMVAAGRFREDLYYRLSVIPIHLPPLRQRMEDIPLLLRHFAAKVGSPQVVFSKDALQPLRAYPWPGNVRELENMVTRLMILREADIIRMEDLPKKILTPQQHEGQTGVVNLPPEGYPLEQLEREVVIEALERNNWNKSAAAAFLKVPRHVLLYRLEKYGIETPSK
ncbi:MAG: DNA-binding response regulator [Deltaproteobacteria bacterium HGW-Deltaproteobacteria-6]|jgi:two-component system NtrC family response regulator|nr:MAG: DNA-binding response regulator [Deltaproteobacteria bacterium HGW-Deltaproteobacteria-6]